MLSIREEFWIDWTNVIKSGNEYWLRSMYTKLSLEVTVVYIVGFYGMKFTWDIMKIRYRDRTKNVIQYLISFVINDGFISHVRKKYFPFQYLNKW